MKQYEKTVVGKRKESPVWFRENDFTQILRDRQVASAITTLIAHRLSHKGDFVVPSVRQIREKMKSLKGFRFVTGLKEIYSIGGWRVSLPVEASIIQDHIYVSSAVSSREVRELLAQILANLLISDPLEARSITDSICQIISCTIREEVKRYLERQGIAWSPSSKNVPEYDFEKHDERVNGAVEEIILGELKKNIDRSIAIRSETRERGGRKVGKMKAAESKRKQEKAELPPIELVQCIYLPVSDSWSPPAKENGSSGGGWSDSDLPDDALNEKVGRRAEELVFQHEREEARKMGFPLSRVVWSSKNNPGADHDILSVDKGGQDVWIEVKATRGKDGRFEWSAPEFFKAVRKGAHYILARVYEANTIHPKVKRLRDPFSLLLNGRMRLDFSAFRAEIEPLGA